MNINVFRLRGVEKQLSRLNDNIERFLEVAYNIRVHGAAAKEEEVEVKYTNEELDWMREQAELMGTRLPKDLENEEG